MLLKSRMREIYKSGSARGVEVVRGWESSDTPRNESVEQQGIQSIPKRPTILRLLDHYLSWVRRFLPPGRRNRPHCPRRRRLPIYRSRKWRCRKRRPRKKPGSNGGANARFGMFITWGPASLKGTEISWSRDAIGRETYDNLYKQFNPVKFDAKEWVAIAKSAGMKYIVFVAKHWDGFCLWPTKTTEYKLGNSPFKRDICGELAKEAQKAGFKIGWYFCPADKHDPDCHTERNEGYLDRMRGQITELLSNYGEISVMWFDYAAPPEGKPWDQENTYALVKKLQPKIIINNRLDMDKMADYWAQQVGPNADYYTPEQFVGGYNDKTPWETNMTIGTQWSYKPNDEIKSAAECIRTLLLCVGSDGNFLFNVGSTPLGEIGAPQPQRLKEAGEWLKKFRESVYGTRGGPFKPNGLIASTRKGNAIYVHVLRPISGTLTLPAVSKKVNSAAVIVGGKLNFKQSEYGITIELPVGGAKPLETEVKLATGWLGDGHRGGGGSQTGIQTAQRRQSLRLERLRQ